MAPRSSSGSRNTRSWDRAGTFGRPSMPYGRLIRPGRSTCALAHTRRERPVASASSHAAPGAGGVGRRCQSTSTVRFQVLLDDVVHLVERRAESRRIAAPAGGKVRAAATTPSGDPCHLVEHFARVKARRGQVAGHAHHKARLSRLDCGQHHDGRSKVLTYGVDEALKTLLVGVVHGMSNYAHAPHLAGLRGQSCRLLTRVLVLEPLKLPSGHFELFQESLDASWRIIEIGRSRALGDPLQKALPFHKVLQRRLARIG